MIRFLLFLFLISTSCRDSFVHAKSEKAEHEIGEKKQSDKSCQTCHAQVRNLAEGKTFDSAGIYPLIEKTRWRQGKRVPVLIESLELEAVKKTSRGEDLAEKNCLSCHLAHGAETKDLTDLEDRKENLGLWVNLQPLDDILDVQVKFKTFGSGHRVPGGLASRAYVIVVQVEQDGKLDLWHGPKIAKPLRRKDRIAGLTMARFFVDEAGNLTSDLKEAHTLLDDTRLEHKRFLGEHFLYQIDPKKKVEAQATLYYLPAFPTWNGALEVLVERSSWEPN